MQHLRNFLRNVSLGCTDNSLGKCHIVIYASVRQQAEIRLKYEGYIKRQLKQVAEFTRMEERALPPDLDYDAVQGLRLEAREKLKKIRPASFGQASRISGVSPADISVLMIYMEAKR